MSGKKEVTHINLVGNGTANPPRKKGRGRKGIKRMTPASRGQIRSGR